jgi:hypothetical protein
MSNQITHHWQRNAAAFSEKMKKEKIEKIADKFRPKPFLERNEKIAIMATIFGYAAQAVIVLASMSFVFFHLRNLCAELPYPNAIAGILSFTFLIVTQLLFRLVISRGFADYFDPYIDTTEVFSQVARLSFIIGLMGLDLFFAYNGSFSAVANIRTAPKLEAPTLFDVSAIQAQYAPLIEDAARGAETFHNARTYLKKLSVQDGRIYKSLLEKKSTLVSEMNQKVSDAEARNDSAIALAKSQHSADVSAFDAETSAQSHGLAIVSIMAFLVAILSIGYSEWWDFKVFSEMDKNDIPLSNSFQEFKSLTNNNYPQKNSIGFNATALRRIMDNPVTTDATVQEQVKNIKIDDRSARFTLLLRDLQAEFSNLRNGNGLPETIKGRISRKISNLIAFTDEGNFSITLAQENSLRGIFYAWNKMQSEGEAIE